MILTSIILIQQAFASEQSLQEKLVGTWEFEFQESFREQNSETRLQMACLEEILPTQKNKKECVALIQVLAASPETGTMDIFIHLETTAKGTWKLEGDSLIIKTLEQKADIKKAHLLINGIDVSGQPEMQDFYQGLTKQVSESLANDETTKRKIVSVNEKEFVFQSDLSKLNPTITATRKK